MVDRLELERRLMIAAVVGTCVSAVFWLIAISTNEWCSVTFDHWRYVNTTSVSIKSFNIGLWKICALVYHNATNTTDAQGPLTKCKTLTMSADNADKDPGIDDTLIHYRRSASAMAVIAMFLSPLAIGFGLYAIKQARYMFKRVAGAFHVINAATAMVSIEVFRQMLHYMNDRVKGYDWFRGQFQYGFSFAFAWITFILLVLSAVTFFMASHKRKREKALSEREARENEPVRIGR